MSRAIIIKTCEKCPHLKTERVYTGDSFDHLTDIKCGKQKDRKISCLDWYDKYPKIPEWCPLPKV